MKYLNRQLDAGGNAKNISLCVNKLTLIEFLVVITLIAMLPPALNSAEIFSATPDYSIELTKPSAIILGDVNNDGKNELIASFQESVNEYKVKIFYNVNGVLEKTPGLELWNVFKNPVCLSVGDFDNDGKTDIAANERYFLRLFLGSENFKSDIYNSNNNPSTNSLYPAKITADGNYDFSSSGALRKWMGGNGWNWGYIYPPEGGFNNTSCIPKDLNNDGLMDIVALVPQQNQLRLYYGPFINLNIKPMDTSKFKILNFEKPISAVIGHLNSDLNLDIAVSNIQKTGIFYQSRPIDFSEDIPSVTINCGGPLLMADFNGDKKDDLAVLDTGLKFIFIFIQKDNKSFPEKPKEADCVIPIKRETGSSFCSGDINGDGLTDLILCDGVSKISIFLNKSNLQSK